MFSIETKEALIENLAPFLEAYGFKYREEPPGLYFWKAHDGDSIDFFFQVLSGGDYLISPFHISISKVEEVLSSLFQKFEISAKPITVSYQLGETMMAMHYLKKEGAPIPKVMEKFKSSFKAQMYQRCLDLLDIDEVYNVLGDYYKPKEKGITIGSSGIPRRLRFLTICMLCNDLENFDVTLRKFSEDPRAYESSPENHKELFEEGIKLIRHIKVG